MRSQLLALAAVLILGVKAVAAGPATAQPRPDLAGRWMTEDFGSIVEFRPCVQAPGEVCGRIVWLRRQTSGGRPGADGRNPNPGLRARPLMGVEIVTGLRETAPGVWTGGRLYNPEEGRTYSGSIRIAGGALELKGCALSIICRSQTWRRANDLAAGAAHDRL